MREPGFYWVRIRNRNGDWQPTTISELRRGKPGWEQWSAMGSDVDHCLEYVEVLSDRLVPPVNRLVPPIKGPASDFSLKILADRIIELKDESNATHELVENINERLAAVEQRHKWG